MSSSSSASLSVDPYHFSAAAAAASSCDQLCYVHCYICDTVLAVSVPASSLFNTVTVRCGHCTNLLPVNMRGLLLPNHFQLALTSPHHNNGLNRLEEMPNPRPDLTMNQPAVSAGDGGSFSTAPATIGLVDCHLPRPPFLNRTATEKRQRIPSAYNRFIKEEIQRIKAENPDISHREAFSAAAKNWAHFPHIHFGLMPDQSCSTVKKAAAAAAANIVNGRQQQEINNGDQGRTNNSTTYCDDRWL